MPTSPRKSKDQNNPIQAILYAGPVHPLDHVIEQLLEEKIPAKPGEHLKLLGYGLYDPAKPDEQGLCEGFEPKCILLMPDPTDERGEITRIIRDWRKALPDLPIVVAHNEMSDDVLKPEESEKNIWLCTLRPAGEAAQIDYIGILVGCIRQALRGHHN